MRNTTYGEERLGGAPEVLEVTYVPVEPFWVLIEPEDAESGGYLLVTCSENDWERGATWYPTLEAAQADAAFAFGWGEGARWVPIPDDVWAVAEFAQYSEAAAAGAGQG